ncbi:MAG: tetratricopeptide repeat-containing sensor histidine kinase [Melioribacteraceae bacterium]|nr:tetratricopeptide repeat-containing sensor histidine kinase [Melioribacteraceae bacterium]
MKPFIILLITTLSLFAQSNPDSIINSLQRLDEKEQIDSLSVLCWNYRSITPKTSIKYGLLALKKMEKISYFKHKSEVLNFLGVIYGNIGNLDSAYYYYQIALDVAKGNKVYSEIAYSLNNIGDYYYKNALYSTALEKMMEAYNIFEEINDKKGMAYVLNDIGEIYRNQKDYEKALDYFDRSAKIRSDRNDTRGLAKSLINIASVYVEQKLEEKALMTFYKAIDLSEKSDYLKGKSWALAGISDVFYAQGKREKALEYLFKALELDTKIQNKYGEISSYNMIGKIYIESNLLVQAEEYLNKAEYESRNTGHLDQLLISYEYQTKLAVGKNNYKLAYDYQKLYEELKEKIYGQENKNKIADLQTAFITERKDRENDLLKKDIEFEKTTRNYAILITILVLASIVLLVMRFKTQKKANLYLTELNSSKDKFFSIIAHDLKNPFGAVSNFAEFLKTDYDDLTESERKEIISGLYEASIDIQKLLMDLLTWARTQKGEIGVTKTKLNIKTIFNSICKSYSLAAKKKSINLRIDIDESLEISADKLIVETVIGNFVNNAIKFSNPNSDVILFVTNKEDKIRFSVSDSGKGMSPAIIEELLHANANITTMGTNNERGTGLGLKICKEFAEIHNGKVLIDSEVGKGSTFSFEINNK